MINTRILSLLCGAATSAIFAGQAMAQGGGSAAPVEEVVVTGSRTVLNGNSSPTPVTVVSAADLQNTTPTTVADALNKLPSFTTASSTAFLNNGSQNYQGAYLNLRGLGTQRTLVLVDGQRATPTAADGTVDTNTLPQMLVQRVDVVTGGASAVYGSDAVSGAVNYVLDHKFNGLKLDLEGGESTYHDDGSYKLGAAAGTAFLDGRLHIEGSVAAFNSDGVPTHLTRPWGKAQICRTGLGTAANPFVDQTNCTGTLQSAGGLITNGPQAGKQFSNSAIVPFVHGILTGTGGTEIGGDGTTSEDTSLAGWLRTQQAYGRADYDVSDTTHAYVEGSVNHSSSGFRFLFQGPGAPLTLSTSNPFLTPTEQAQLSATGAATFTMAKQFNTGDGAGTTITALTDTWNFTAGLDGKFDDGRFSWSAYYTHGHAFMTSTTNQNISEQKLAAGLDAVINPANGQVVCHVTLTNPGLYPGCTPINPFGPTSPTDVLKYAEVNSYITQATDMDDFGATLSGQVFDLPAGPLVGALNVEYRRLSLAEATPYPANTPVDCTGLTLNCPAVGFASIYDEATGMPFSASENVKEVAVEVTAPLLKGVTLAQSLELNAAGRYTDYSTSGGVETYKLGAVWVPVDDLTLRVTRSQDIRAPSLFDLFQPETLSLRGFGSDIHTGGTTGNITADFSGNPNLVPEVAQTLTAGVVYEPHWLPGASFSLDYFKIKLGNAISQVTGGPDYNNICEQSGGTSQYCALFVRPLPFSNHTPANFPTREFGGPQNVALVETDGFDIESGYRFDLPSLWDRLDGGLNLRFLATYQPNFYLQSSAISPKFQQAGAANAVVSGNPAAHGEPIWKTNFRASYSLGSFDVNAVYRWRSAMSKDYNPLNVYTVPKIGSRGYTDLNVTYNFEWEDRQAALFLLAQNLFNVQPVYYQPTNGFLIGLNNPTYGGDDPIGAYYTIGVRLSM